MGLSASKSPSTTSIKSFLLGAKANPIKKNIDSNNTLQGSETVNQSASSDSFKQNSSRKESPQSHGTHGLGQTLTHKSNLESKGSKKTSSSNSSVPKEKNSIDMEVLQALPKEMREQVIAEYRQQGYVIPTQTFGDKEGEPQPSTSGYVQPKKKTGKLLSNSSHSSDMSVDSELQKTVMADRDLFEDYPLSNEDAMDYRQENSLPEEKQNPESKSNAVLSLIKDFSCGLRNSSVAGVQKNKQNTEVKSLSTLNLAEDLSHGSSNSVGSDAGNERLITSFSQVSYSHYFNCYSGYQK